MEHVDTLITSRWIIPIEPFGTVLEHHAVAIRNGRIVALLPEKQALEQFSTDNRIARPSHVLLPGLVNTHTQAAMSLLRGWAAGGQSDDPSKVRLRSFAHRWLDAEFICDGTDLAIADMLTSGTTCFASMQLYSEVAAQTAAAARIRAAIASPILDTSTSWAESADEYLDKGLRLHDEYRDDPLISTMLAPFVPSAVGDATLRRVQRLADELESPVTIQIDESRVEASDSAERPIARLERVGLLSPLLTAVHFIHATEDDLERAAVGGISVAHCPQSDLDIGLCPVGALREHGLNLTLGTAGTTGGHDLFSAIRIAALLANGVDTSTSEPADRMSAHDWLQSATLNGARALGLGDRIGSIVPDKWADLCCVDLLRAQTQPVHDPAAQLLNAVSRDQVSDVWVAGRALLAAGLLTQLDLADVLRRAQLWQQRIAGSHT